MDGMGTLARLRPRLGTGFCSKVALVKERLERMMQSYTCRAEVRSIKKVNVERYYPMKLDEEYCQGSLYIDIDIVIDIDTPPGQKL